MRKILLTLMLCTFMPAAMFCQNLTGSQITNETAAELWLYQMTQLSPTTLITDTLANNVGLSGQDINTTITAINNFGAQYQSAIANYNSSVNGVTDQATLSNLHTAFKNNTATITNNAVVFLEDNLSTQGYAALHTYVLNERNSMSLAANYYENPPYMCTHLGLSAYESVTLTQNIQPKNPSMTITVTVSGDVVCPTGATAIATATIKGVGTQTKSASGTGFISAVADVYVYDPIDECYEDENGVCGDPSEGSGSGEGGYFLWNNPQTFRETARTMVTNTYETSFCSTTGEQCDWIVANWCTVNSQPPDNNMQGQTIWWPRATVPLYWLVYARCWTFYTNTLGRPVGPWNCSYGFAWNEGNNQPFYPCTSNPGP